ncbi:MAG: elongation factor EF-2 [Candidatus Aenigmatarchaeota archaeon]
MAKEKLAERVKKLMSQQKQIRNIGTAAHIDHGKTTLTDNLLAGAGMISDELAGDQLFMDYDDQEQERGITIYSANVSMVHDFKGDDYLINLIDTPGHVDFGGDVTRAMRAVDGVIILTCAVEGVMPQTETVIQQALKERVKPILFINKVDRLINELELDAEGMQEKFMKIIREVNNLIRKYAEDEYKDKWTVSVDDGSVMFGSALKNWAISKPYMKETGITFKDIQEKCSKEKHKELWKEAPLHQIVLNGIIRHLPNPKKAQNYRIPKIWPGDEESQAGKDMKGCDADGELAAITTKVYNDPHAGSVATGRVFSGALTEGQEVHLVGQHKDERIQQVCIYKGQERVQMDEVQAGNIIGLVGVPDAFSGETICNPDYKIDPFEEIKHVFEPVVTKAVEAKKTKDLPDLVQFLRKASREDPTLLVEIDEETGEHLVSGLGELHIQAKVEKGLQEEGIPVETSPPIVVYRETLKGESNTLEGKSPNKHNKFYFEVEPLDDDVYEAIAGDEIQEGEYKGKDSDLANKLKDLGMDDDDAEGVELIKEKNIFTDATKGIQYLNDTIELVREAVRDIIEEGPLAREPCSKILIRLVDAKLHEDAIHRGPAQVTPAVRHAVKNAILSSKPTLLEPKQILRVEAPQEHMGNVMTEVQNRRGEVINVDTEQGTAVLKVKLPVEEMFGFEGELKSATEGKGFYYLKDVLFEYMPDSLKDERIKDIRERKGLGREVPQPEA